MSSKGQGLLQALKHWGLTQFVVALLVVSALLFAAEPILQHYPQLFVSVVVYCLWSGLLAHLRVECTVYRNTKAHCEAGKNVSGIHWAPFYLILAAHMVGFALIAYLNLRWYLFPSGHLWVQPLALP